MLPVDDGRRLGRAGLRGGHVEVLDGWYLSKGLMDESIRISNAGV